MKTITLGNANAAAYEVVAEFENMYGVIERLAERDIRIVVVSRKFLKGYTKLDMEILKDTFARYGAILEIEEPYGIEEENETAVIVTRGENSVEQVAICQEYADRNGIEVIDIITQETNEIHANIGNVDYVLVSHLSRIARRYEEYKTIKSALDADGIKIIAITK